MYTQDLYPKDLKYNEDVNYNDCGYNKYTN